MLRQLQSLSGMDIHRALMLCFLASLQPHDQNKAGLSFAFAFCDCDCIVFLCGYNAGKKGIARIQKENSASNLAIAMVC